MVRSADLLAAAAELYDSGTVPPPEPGGFRQGADWMRRALQILRGEPIPRRASAYNRVGIGKYGLCLVGGVIGGVPGFYAVEAQMVFLFPLLIDGVPDPIRASRALTRRAGGTAEVMRIVLPIAAQMLSGGPRGQGAVRSWCLGCLAILLWYEAIDGRHPGEDPPRIELGARGALSIRSEPIVGLQTGRLLFASDLHLSGGWTAGVVEQLLDAAHGARPDAILLGGDLVDSHAGLRRLAGCVEQLRRIAVVAAIAGNHDAWVGAAAVRRCVQDAGGLWLSQGRLDNDGSPIGAVGDRAASIWVAHHPGVFPRAAEQGIRLVLAGHLHGGQVVLWRRAARAYPGAFLSRFNGPRFERGGSTLLVSQGVNDTLPVRYGCPREVVLVEPG